MTWIQRFLWAALSVSLLAVAFPPQNTPVALAQTEFSAILQPQVHSNYRETTPLAVPPAPDMPKGFQLIMAETGVSLFQKNYKNGTPDYVQVIDFAQGAGVQLLHGDILNDGTDKGVYGGDNPRFERQSLKDFWKDFTRQNDRALCATNGLFFYMPDSATRLAFPLKKDGKVLTDGYGIKEYPEMKLMLEIWPQHVDIRELSQEALYTSRAPNIIAGLHEDANKRANKYVGRTFIGIDDRDRDGLAEILMIFSTQTARQEDAAEVLRSFGADKVMMLDGGGSTMLRCKNKDFIYSERLIPQALGIWAGPSPTPSSTAIPTITATQAPPATTLPPTPTIPHEALLGAEDEAPPSPAQAFAKAILGQDQPVQNQPAQDQGALLGQGQGSEDAIQIGNALWVPLLMVPFILGLAFAIIKRQMNI